MFTYSLYIHDRIERDEPANRVAAWDGKFDTFKGAVRDVDRHLSSVVYQEIDLPGAGWQPIAGGFYVIDLAACRAEGREGDRQGDQPDVRHARASTVLDQVGEKKATFTLPHVPPGVAQPFEVAVPDVPARRRQAPPRARQLDHLVRELDDAQGPRQGPGRHRQVLH